MMNKPRSSKGWDRAQLTIRLTPARKQMLRRLTDGERIAGGPGAAIDRALEMAVMERVDDTASRVEQLEEAVRDCAERAARDAKATASELARLSASLDALRRFLAELSEAE